MANQYAASGDDCREQGMSLAIQNGKKVAAERCRQQPCIRKNEGPAKLMQGRETA
jgi:hypothetical protein